MGISLLTALTIQANKTKIATGKGANGKYGFEIYCIIREHYRPQITCQPIYNTDEIAKIEGEKLLKSIMEFDADKHRKGLSDLLGDAAEPVEKIISASKRGI